MNIRRVLHPTDFSESAWRALPYAVDLARAHGAELHLLHVLMLRQIGGQMVEVLFPEEEVRRRLAAAPKTPKGRGDDVRVVRSVRRGISAADVIGDYAAEREIDIVSMGSRGWRGLRKLVLGSVAEETVRISEAPVLVVRGAFGEASAPAEAPGFRRILVAPEIVPAATECGADLTVIASHGLSGLDRVFMGSVAERILRRARSSVLIVKPFDRQLVTPVKELLEDEERRDPSKSHTKTRGPGPISSSAAGSMWKNAPPSREPAANATSLVDVKPGGRSRDPGGVSGKPPRAGGEPSRQTAGRRSPTFRA